MWWLAACARDPKPADSGTPPVDSAPAVDSGDTVEPWDPPTPTGDTGDSAVTPTAGPDPFLTGDPAELIAVVQLAFGITTDQWFVSASSFAAGSQRWTGVLAVPYAGVDTCEVRTGDPELASTEASLGALSVQSGAAVVDVTEIFTGAYVASVDVAAVDPRGLAWDVAFAGASPTPGFALPAAVVFPAGDLGVDAPVDDQAVDRTLPLSIAWTGTPAQYVQLDLIPEDQHEWVRCLVADDGGFNVGADALGALTPGRLEVTVARTNAAGPEADQAGHWVQVVGQLSLERYVDLE